MDLTAILILAAIFVGGVTVGYGIRSLASKKRRERARKRRVYFHDRPEREVTQSETARGDASKFERAADREQPSEAKVEMKALPLITSPQWTVKEDTRQTQRINLPAPVADIYRAVADLEKLYPGRKFTPDGHLVGSIGEVIAAENFGLMLHGMNPADAFKLAHEALERVKLGDAAFRKIAGYSKGMRQKIRLAQAIAHHPRVLVLDEPLNGLDPMARAESLALFEELGRQGMHLVISSHILDEVDRISDRVVLITGGYLIAEGNIHQVRQEVRDKPMQVLIRCDKPELLASKMFSVNHCVEARLHADGRGVFLRTGDIDQFYTLLNGIAVEGLVRIETVAPADDDAYSIYQYLIGSEGSTR